MRRSLALFAVLFLSGAAAACGGSAPDSSFPTRAEAGAAVPAWVPAGATGLTFRSEESSGAFWLRFRLPAADRPALEAELNRIPDEQVATLTFRPLRRADSPSRRAGSPASSSPWFLRRSEPPEAW